MPEFPFISSVRVAIFCALSSGRRWMSIPFEEREAIKNIVCCLAEIVSKEDGESVNWQDIVDWSSAILKERRTDGL